MEFQYYLVYLIVNIVCVAFVAIILMRLNSNIGSSSENRIFRMMLIMYLAFLVCEIVWVLGEGKFVSISPFVYNTVKVAGTAFIPIMVYFWFRYAEMIFENPFARKIWFKLITAIPVIAMIAVYVSSPSTGLIAKILPDGTVVNGPMVGLTGVIDNLYGLAVVIHAVILLIKNRSNIMKRRVYLTHIMFIVICTLGGIADAVIKGTPIMPLAIMLSYNVLFINLQESKIFNDALTGVSNRRQAVKYVREVLSETSEKDPFCLILLDIDDFGSINEKHGQAEGDKALMLTSECINEVAGRRNGFVARWGGDEFLVVIKTGDIKEVESFENEVSTTIDRAARLQTFPYTISLSLGQEMCDRNDRDVMEIIDCAEKRLNEAKNISTLGI